MVEYQVEWEYSDGNTIILKTENLKIRYRKPGFRIDTRVDGIHVVTDPGIRQYIFTFTTFLTAANMNIMDGVERGAITYTGAYPRIKKIHWDGATNETNIEVAIPDGGLEVLDDAPGGWICSIRMEEKTQ